jgi:hypothetical protein
VTEEKREQKGALRRAGSSFKDKNTREILFIFILNAQFF